MYNILNNFGIARTCLCELGAEWDRRTDRLNGAIRSAGGLIQRETQESHRLLTIVGKKLQAILKVTVIF